MSDQRVSDASGNAKRIAGSFTASTITILTETRCKTPWINNPVTGRASAVAGGAGVADLAGVAELAGHTANHTPFTALSVPRFRPPASTPTPHTLRNGRCAPCVLGATSGTGAERRGTARVPRRSRDPPAARLRGR